MTIDINSKNYLLSDSKDDIMYCEKCHNIMNVRVVSQTYDSVSKKMISKTYYECPNCGRLIYVRNT